MIDRFLGKKFIGSIILVAVIVFLFIAGLYFYNFFGALSSKQSAWADFGAYLGGTLGATFAFLSFSTLLLTLYLQKKELSTAIEALQKSVDSQEAQKFETTFYSLLQLHNQTLKELQIADIELHCLFDNDPVRANLQDLTDEEISKFDPERLISIEEASKNPDEYMKNLQETILTNVDLSQYFRVLYQLLKFIAKNNIKNESKSFDMKYLSVKEDLEEEIGDSHDYSDEDKLNQEKEDLEYEKMYSSLVRSFVPVKILPILALNCIYIKEGYRVEGLHNIEKYWALLERYEFLEHIRLDVLPTNLATFVILNKYNNAMGNNKDIREKFFELRRKYPKLFPDGYSEVLGTDGYLFNYSLYN